jgi:ketosteroid isomerase-like protein
MGRYIIKQKVLMAMNPKVSDEATVAAIANLQRAWLDAVRAADVERIVGMVTDDIVVVHGNGRCLHGRDEMRADFLRGFEAFSICQSVSPVEVIVRGEWGLEISEIDTELTPRSGGESKLFHSTTRDSTASATGQILESCAGTRALGLIQAVN